ncbi:MAG TPA: uracil-DNA glycosylase [Candidatus Binatia bacterium]|nr:uracil-DNA glycosylase [Candidatus Binatia bacterium]
MTDPRLALADTLRDLASTLRHHRDLGLTAIPMTRTPFPDPADVLAAQEADLQGCPRCKLSRSRSTIVFGSGNPRAKLVVIGEGPGEEEDKQGKPFVGRAGQLLTRMLASVGFDRERDCYIANVVKCRPERNRNPEADEVAACSPFLLAQLDAIRPRVILALGNFAAQTLLGTREGITKLRGRTYPYRAIVLVPTFHPAFLLRNPGPEYRRMAWDDLKLARREHERLAGGPSRPAHRD